MTTILIPRAKPKTQVCGPIRYKKDESLRVGYLLDGKLVALLGFRDAKAFANLLASHAKVARERPQHSDRERLISASYGTVGAHEGKVVVKRHDTLTTVAYDPEEAERLAKLVWACADACEAEMWTHIEKFHSDGVTVKRVQFRGETIPIVESIKQYERLG